MFEKFLVPHLACDNHIKHSHCVYYLVYLYIFPIYSWRTWSIVGRQRTFQVGKIALEKRSKWKNIGSMLEKWPIVWSSWVSICYTRWRSVVEDTVCHINSKGWSTLKAMLKNLVCFILHKVTSHQGSDMIRFVLLE